MDNKEAEFDRPEGDKLRKSRGFASEIRYCVCFLAITIFIMILASH